MSQMLDQLLPKILEAFRDKENLVREAACVAIGQFSRSYHQLITLWSHHHSLIYWIRFFHLSEHLQPEIITYHNVIMPVLLSSLHDPVERVKIKCCFALELFCTNLEGDEVLPYVESLMTNFMHLVQTGSRPIQETVVAAIGLVIVVLSLTDFLNLLYQRLCRHCFGVEVLGLLPS